MQNVKLVIFQIEKIVAVFHLRKTTRVFSYFSLALLLGCCVFLWKLYSTRFGKKNYHREQPPRVRCRIFSENRANVSSRRRRERMEKQYLDVSPKVFHLLFSFDFFLTFRDELAIPFSIPSGISFPSKNKIEKFNYQLPFSHFLDFNSKLKNIYFDVKINISTNILKFQILGLKIYS